MAKPVAIAMPRIPSQSPARAMRPHRAVVSVGHGDTTASSGAKKKPVPTYQDDPVRSETITKRNHRGTAGALVMSFRIIALLSRRLPDCRP
jgi:hypothetical protein